MNRILIVEDEPRISSFIAKGLRANGFTPTVVADGTTGLDYALSAEFDLVNLDIGLPGIGTNFVYWKKSASSCLTASIFLCKLSNVS